MMSLQSRSVMNFENWSPPQCSVTSFKIFHLMLEKLLKNAVVLQGQALSKGRESPTTEMTTCTRKPTIGMRMLVLQSALQILLLIVSPVVAPTLLSLLANPYLVFILCEHLFKWHCACWTQQDSFWCCIQYILFAFTSDRESQPEGYI